MDRTSITKKLRSNLRRALGPKLLGMIDYYRYPEYRQSWGGPFNGQTFRQQIFVDLANAVELDLIVETGTYRGTTTEYLRRTAKVPVYTVEHDQRSYGFSKMRFGLRRGIKVSNSDSRSFLRGLTKKAVLKDKTVFFYLDAHWSKDLPLAEEIEIVFEGCDRAVVMIDDFQVPDDDQYAYDNYGEGKALTLAYLERATSKFGLVGFFPSSPAQYETGARRGCVVLVNNPELLDRVGRSPSLRRWALNVRDGEFPVPD